MAKQKTYAVKIKSKNTNKITVEVNSTPRNKVVVALIARGNSGAGSHGKSKKAKRNQDKRDITKMICIEM